MAGLGFSGLGPSGQPVYETKTEIGRLVIPAQMLVLATIGINRELRAALLRPWGPRFLMSALALGQELAMRLTPNRMFRISVEIPTVVQRLRWVLTFPSPMLAGAASTGMP